MTTTSGALALMATLETERLVLRPFRRSDAAEFTRLAGDWAVASMTSDIPYPLSQAPGGGLAEAGARRGAVCHRAGGAADRRRGFYRRRSGAAELGFWLGRPWWGHGYATEAARAVVRHGLQAHGCPASTSSHFVDNWASADVLRKLGFEPVGRGLHRQRRARPRRRSRNLLARRQARAAAHSCACRARSRKAALARLARQACRRAGLNHIAFA